MFGAEWRTDVRGIVTEAEKSARRLFQEFRGEAAKASGEVERREQAEGGETGSWEREFY